MVERIWKLWTNFHLFDLGFRVNLLSGIRINFSEFRTYSMHIYNALLNLKWVNPFTYNSFRRFRISKFLKRIRKACSNNYIYIYIYVSLWYTYLFVVSQPKKL